MSQPTSWSDPNADVIGDVRRAWIQQIGEDKLRSVGSWGPGAVWFLENGETMSIDEGLRRYAG